MKSLKMQSEKFSVTELEERLEFCNCPPGYNPVTFMGVEQCSRVDWRSRRSLVPCQ